MSALLPRVPHSPRPWLLGRGTSRAATAAAARRPGLRPSAALLNSAGLPAEAPQLVFATSGAAKHDFPGHKECAARVPAILSAIEAGGLLPAARPGQVAEVTGLRPATLDEVLAIHDPQYVSAVQRVSSGGGATVIEPSPTYVTSSTYADGLLAAGAVLSLVDAVMAAAPCSGQAQQAQQQEQRQQQAPTAFAICRPPGHHAIPKGAMGFCIFSNAAIAARYAQQSHGAKKVAIFDFDVHHGNGTNDIFFDDPSVLFVSTHQSGLFPNTGKITEVGVGAGEGASINVPLPGDSGHEAILAVYDEVVAPALRRFQPALILISAGYDAHWRDPLAGLQLRTSTYHVLAGRIRQLAEELCQGRLVMLLEGGYDLKALGESVENTFLGVLGEGARDKFNPDLLRDEPLDKVRAVIAEAQRIHGL